MIYSINCAVLSSALEQLQKTVEKNEESGVKTVVFCEDRLSLAAERFICDKIGGTFSTSVYTLSRFLSAERGKPQNVLSGQGSAMAVRKIIEERKAELTLFKQLSGANSAQAVYDTIALLYSSRVSAEDALKAAESGGVLGGKLRDVAVIYSYYEKYLKESGKQDRNGYLRQLPEVIESSPKIRGNAVIFLGFQAFTCMARECVRAALSAAESVYGLFIGGKEDLYVNEAFAAFCGVAEEFGGAQISSVNGTACEDADALRRGIFNPDSFYRAPVPTKKISLFEAADGDEEFEFIAANIKKHISSGARFAEISVMLPNLEVNERPLARTFSRFKIPYYADRQRALAEHPLCAFVLGLFSCALYGCAFQDADGVVSSPFFLAEIADKDVFRNYLLRLGNFRGGIKREPNPEILQNLGFDIDAVQRVRKPFLSALAKLDIKSGISGICGGVRAVLSDFGVENTLKSLAEKYENSRPATAEFSARAYQSLISVLNEAESLAPDSTPLPEFVKMLKSGFAAMKVSLIPPKSDAVFVGDLSATANTGSKIVFAARLTGDAPAASSDTSLLTDREIAALESVNLNISPKIRQVNARRREICALNVCAFSQNLYLSYPAGEGGGESGVSEIISYAKVLFLSGKGARLAPVTLARIENSGRAVPYYCSEKLPALKHLAKHSKSPEASAVYKILKENGFGDEADKALEKPVKRGISCGKRLYLSKAGSLSPTALESYFACPYLSFVRQGLKIKEREEGAVRPVDAGNFIHSVLQDLAVEVNSVPDTPALEARAKEIAELKLSKPPYSALAESKSGEYVSKKLVDEAVKISAGMYEQLKNSTFKVSKAECASEVRLNNNVKIFGRIDRVDESGDLVRIVDYKTGAIDGSPSKYYMGAKLQLPLYLLSVSEGKRAAGAYYFPASLEYRERADGTFRLQGFMDGSDDVVLASDSTVQPKQKSGFVDAYYQGRKIESAMDGADFKDFLDYSKMVASLGVEEMLAGNVTPSPAEGVCKYCKAGGSCGFGKDEKERKPKGVKCSQIAEIVRKEKGDETHR